MAKVVPDDKNLKYLNLGLLLPVIGHQASRDAALRPKHSRSLRVLQPTQREPMMSECAGRARPLPPTTLLTGLP